MDVTFAHKGKSATATIADATAATTDVLFAEAERLLELEGQNIKILYKGKQLLPGVAIAASPLAGATAAKCMVMATGAKAIVAVQEARADPTIRGFASEDAAAAHHQQETRAPREEVSEWARPQDARYKFCRFEPCTWQSFGTRPSSKTPHAFEARALLVKLAQDPGVVAIMQAREYTVGLLAEQDPIDDRHAEKMEGEGKRLLGYNTNAGAEIHIRLRTEDLSGFLPYPSLVDTLLHELCHNQIGPHNEQFWHLFCQLKADYLRRLLSLSAAGDLFGGRSALGLAQAAEEASDVRTSVLMALSRDRQAPASQMQVTLLDAYLEATGGVAATASGRTLGGAAAPTGGGQQAAASAAEMRQMLTAKASARQVAAAGGGVAEHRGQPAEPLPVPPPPAPSEEAAAARRANEGMPDAEH